MSVMPEDPVAALFTLVNALLANKNGLQALAVDPARRLKLEAEIKRGRAQLASMRVKVASSKGSTAWSK